MPNRILKESLLYSQDIAQLTEAEEAFFYRLLVNADDYGRFFADPEVVRARCYPRGRIGVTEHTVREHLSRLVDVGMVELYEFEGDQFLQIASWERHQQKRANRSKFPDPPAPTRKRKQRKSSDINGKQPQEDVPETTRLRDSRDETTRSEKREIAPLPARERDPIWDVLDELYGEAESGDGKRNAAAKKLRLLKATEEEIRHRYEMLIGTDESWAVVTPNAMAVHFGNKALLAKQGRTKDRASQIAAMAESMRGSKRKALPS